MADHTNSTLRTGHVSGTEQSLEVVQASMTSMEEAREERRRVSEQAKCQRKYQRKLVSLLDLDDGVVCAIFVAPKANDRDIFVVQSTLKGLRSQVTQLESELKDLTGQLEEKAAQNTLCKSVRDDVDIGLKLKQLEATKAALRAENIRLRGWFRASMGHMARLQDLLDAEHRLYLANSSYFVLLKRLTPPECEQVRRDTMKRRNNFSFDANCVRSAGKICGWDQRRSADCSDFRFSLQKMFKKQQASHLALLTWQLITNPRTWEKLFTPQINMRIRFVQQVDDDNAIFFLDYSAMDMHNDLIVENNMNLISKYTVDGGFEIMLCGLARDRVVVEDLLGPRTYGHRREEVIEQWSNHVCWIRLEQRGWDCCATYSGVGPTICANAVYWLAEVVRHTLSWERILIAPKFSLPSESEVPADA